MIDVGDIHLADLNEERRRRVLVVSIARFHRAADRVLIAPETLGPPDDVPFPWRVAVDGAVFAVDFLRTIPLDRLLDRTGGAPLATMLAVRRAILNIT